MSKYDPKHREDIFSQFLDTLIELGEKEYDEYSFRYPTRPLTIDKITYIKDRVKDIAEQLFWVTNNDNLRKLLEHTHTVGSYEDGQEETGSPNI